MYGRIGGLEAASGPEPDGNGAIEMPAGDVADRIGHGQHSQSECKADPQEPDAQRREARGEDRTAATSECQPEGAKEFGPKTSPHIHVSPVGLISLVGGRHIGLFATDVQVAVAVAEAAMSALGHKRTWRGLILMSALPPKADIDR
jgi:hypothetical protein